MVFSLYWILACCMRNERMLVFLLHSVVRAMLLEHPVNEAYLLIFKSIFPCAVRGDFVSSTQRTDQHYLQGICDYIYEMDERESGNASCYSASVVAQIIAYSRGLETEMILGVKKEDERVVGHAWIEMTGQPAGHAISPGRVRVDDFRILKRYNPEEVIRSWVEEKCAFG